MKIRCVAALLAITVAAVAAYRPMASGAEKAPTGNTAAEDKLLAVLRSDAPAQDKCNACRELKTVGTERSVEALAGLAESHKKPVRRRGPAI